MYFMDRATLSMLPMPAYLPQLFPQTCLQRALSLFNAVHVTLKIEHTSTHSFRAIFLSQIASVVIPTVGTGWSNEY